MKGAEGPTLSKSHPDNKVSIRVPICPKKLKTPLMLPLMSCGIFLRKKVSQSRLETPVDIIKQVTQKNAQKLSGAVR